MTGIGRIRNAAFGDSGSRRLVIVVGAAAVLAGGAYVFLGGTPAAPTSIIPQIPGSTRTVQGGEVPTQEMSEALRKASADRLAAASDQGGSAMPTVEAKLVKDVSRPAEDGLRLTDDDRIVRPPPPVIERPQINVPAYTPAPSPVQQAAAEAPDRTADEFRKYLDVKPEKYGPASVQYLWKGGAPEKPNLAALQAQGAPRGATADSVGPGGVKLPLPGTIVYAEMVSSANSDTPGPVVARIVQGDLSGATLIGAFQTQRDGMYISFKTLSLARNRDGEEINKAISVNAVAVDSVNVGTGIASDVDRHILQNVGIATAAAFAQGLGQAIATSGQTFTQGALTGTTVINPYRRFSDQLYIAGGTAGGAMGQAIVRAYGNRPTTVTVNAGTPVGILFMPTSGAQ